jgi:hypothetical protein
MAEAHYSSYLTISWDETLSSFGKDGRRRFVLYYPMWGVGELKSVIGEDCVLDFKSVGKLNEKRKVAWMKEACIPLHPGCLLAGVYSDSYSSHRFRFRDDKVGVVRQILREAPPYGIQGHVLRDYLLYISLAITGSLLASYDREEFAQMWKEVLVGIGAHPEISAPQGELGEIRACSIGEKLVPGASTGSNDAAAQVVIRAKYPCHPVDLAAVSAPGEPRSVVRRFRFSSTYPIPVLVGTLSGGYDVETKYPSELERGDIVMLMRNSPGGIIAELADADLGSLAKEVRSLAGQWRDALEEWEGDAEKLAAVIRVSSSTASNWILGKLKIAPRKSNLSRLSAFFSRRGIKFDALKCAKMSTVLFGAHNRSGRKLKKILEEQARNYGGAIRFQKVICVNFGKRDVHLDLYAVGNVHRRKMLQSADGLNQFG